MLSKTERQLVEGKLEVNDEYRRLLVHRIKRKAKRMREELQLIDAYLEKYAELKRQRLKERAERVRRWWHNET